MQARRPEECDQLLFETIESGDLDAALDIYEQAAVFVVAPGQVVSGRPAIREVLKGMLAMGGLGKIERVTSVSSTDGTVAFTRTKGSSTYPDPDGKPVTVQFHSVEVVRRQRDGTWRIVIDDPSGEGLG
jgi:uncharacterized protein (TIGR02246 family)